MPAYNNEKYINQAIKSIINQTYEDWELLIIDDCSTDQTQTIIKSFASIDTRIQLIYRDTNSGKPSIAKNGALPLAKGDYIAFLDSDDLWLPEKLEKQILLMESNQKLGLTYTGGYWIDENDNIIKSFLPKYPNGSNLNNMLFRYELNNQSVMITKEALNNTLCLFNENILIGEDYNLFMHIIAKYDIASIKEYLIQYRIHEAALTKKKKQISDGVLLTLKELNKSYKIFWKLPFLSLLTYLKAIRFKYLVKKWS